MATELQIGVVNGSVVQRLNRSEIVFQRLAMGILQLEKFFDLVLGQRDFVLIVYMGLEVGMYVYFVYNAYTLKTVQMTTSSQVGVVNEPLYLQNSLTSLGSKSIKETGLK